MPSENVELVRLGFEMFEREGPASFRPPIDLAEQEIECYAAPGVEPTGRYQGTTPPCAFWREVVRGLNQRLNTAPLRDNQQRTPSSGLRGQIGY
jgi:hypothetical protein